MTMPSFPKAILRAAVAAIVVVGLLCGGAVTALAHIQVSPTLAAPDDAVRFTVLVPGERAPQWTRQVVLKIPPGVLPYSFQATPGWTRKLGEAKDGSTDRVIWSGRLDPDGFVEFSFLAATPPSTGRLTWKALQVYNDGQVVRWIGSPDSEEPAPITLIRKGVPLQNAGGEGASGATAAEVAEVAPAAAQSGDGDGGGTDWLGRGLALAALAISTLVLLLALRRRKDLS